jgi:HK97 family phage major capsid protein
MLDFIETEKIRRAKNIIDSFTRPEPHEDETYSVSRAVVSLFGHHWPGFSLENVPRWDDSLEKCEHVKLKRKFESLQHEFMAGDLLVPSWAWQRPLYNSREMSIGSGPKGGYLVGYDMPFHDSLLRAQSVAFQAGVQLVQAGSNALAWPKQVTASTPAWLSPGVGATASAGTYVQISSTLKTIVAVIEVPLQLLKQGGPAAEVFITDELQRDLATAVDQAVLVGTGASGQPLGIINTPGIGTFSGTTLGYPGLVEAQTDVADANAVLNPNGLHYITTPGVASLLKSRQRFTSTDSPAWAGAIHRGMVEGIPALSTKQMPSATMLYGDFTAAYLVEWGGLVLRINPYQDFNKGIVGIRAMWMVDVVVRYPLSFSYASSIN